MYKISVILLLSALNLLKYLEFSVNFTGYFLMKHTEIPVDLLKLYISQKVKMIILSEFHNSIHVHVHLGISKFL